ncbi:MAG: DUF45 domain-containing protein [Candidatus Obscuribacterales bacterium]|nr:DUF45 domain-containing protein [Candidatus Obscuribacterales bacterium]
MANNNILSRAISSPESRTLRKTALCDSGYEPSLYEMYRSFMDGYVRRVNQETFKVGVGLIQIVPGLPERLARLDLAAKNIVFSIHAVDNVSERCRRYLVIHQLAHFIEPSHEERFFNLVERFEPHYKSLGRQLSLFSRRNATEERLVFGEIEVRNPDSGRLERPKLLISGKSTRDILPGSALETRTGTYSGGTLFDCLTCQFQTTTTGATVPGGVDRAIVQGCSA